MNEPSLSIWRRPWNGPAKSLAWLALLALATFFILFAIHLSTQQSGPGADDLLAMALAASMLAALITGSILVGRWLCSWRNLRRFLFALACLLTLIALSFAEENWRGKHSWLTHRRLLEAAGERFSLSDLVPPAVPDEKNFALAPLLKPALDLYHSPKGLVWRDTNGLARLERSPPNCLSTAIPTTTSSWGVWKKAPSPTSRRAPCFIGGIPITPRPPPVRLPPGLFSPLWASSILNSRNSATPPPPGPTRDFQSNMSTSPMGHSAASFGSGEDSDDPHGGSRHRLPGLWPVLGRVQRPQAGSAPVELYPQ